VSRHRVSFPHRVTLAGAESESPKDHPWTRRRRPLARDQPRVDGPDPFNRTPARRPHLRRFDPRHLLQNPAPYLNRVSPLKPAPAVILNLAFFLLLLGYSIHTGPASTWVTLRSWSRLLEPGG